MQVTLTNWSTIPPFVVENCKVTEVVVGAAPIRANATCGVVPPIAVQVGGSAQVPDANLMTYAPTLRRSTESTAGPPE
jgi:hypothetical protein